ncbi:MAG TPA: hypothetical protein VGH34_15775 [Vicinamibacterales bacterium]
MRRLLTAFVLLTALAAPAAASRAPDDPLARARLLYNQHDFQGAIAAAEQARVLPGRADAADLVAARAYLESYRQSLTATDLDGARERLRRLDPLRLAANEREEYVVGLGETLFFDGAFGAAANVFDGVIKNGTTLAGVPRERVLDWWASAIDREAKPRPDIERQSRYQAIRTRMEQELATHPGSGAAAYWLANAARLQGDLSAAWDAAQAGWVRAPLGNDHGVALRGDIDRLVVDAIVPDRAKALAQTPETIRQEWEQFKEMWQK